MIFCSGRARESRNALRISFVVCMARLWGFRPAMQEAARIIHPLEALGGPRRIVARSFLKKRARRPGKAEQQRPGSANRSRATAIPDRRAQRLKPCTKMV